MILFVGLGNPSPDNENNRHNIGFKIIDAINKKFSLSKQKPKFKGLLTTGTISDKKVYIPKRPGEPDRSLADISKIKSELNCIFYSPWFSRFFQK